MTIIETAEHEAISELNRVRDELNDDPEAAHSHADQILCEFLERIGFHNVVHAWQQIDKWYA